MDVVSPVGNLDAVDALTADGRIVTIRPIQPSDRRQLARLYGDAAPESLRLRFFAQPGSATLAAEVDRLCRPPSDRIMPPGPRSSLPVRA